jgi:hypothetical protein
MILPPIAILGLAVVVVGVINFERWGNALTFADFHYYNNISANLIPILNTYGEFNVSRIWIGALQYATDIPYLLHTLPPFAEFLRARVVYIEAPPITPVLTNPLTIILAGIGLYRVWWHPVTILRLVLIGHASAVVLVLGYWFFLLHYRFDFAPFFTLAALIGYSSVSIAVTKASKSLQKRVSIAAIGLCFLGIVSSHYELLLHKVYSYAVPIEVRITLLRFAPFAHYVRDFQTERR